LVANGGSNLLDEEILIQLGATTEGSSIEERQRYVDGLSTMLITKTNTDLDTIAPAIVEYRRNFIGDESRVLTHIGDVGL
jgi:hypothetical protein